MNGGPALLLLTLALLAADDPTRTPLALLESLPPPCYAPTPGKLDYQAPIKRLSEIYFEILIPSDKTKPGMFAQLLKDGEHLAEDKPTEEELKELMPNKDAFDKNSEKHKLAVQTFQRALDAMDEANEALREDHHARAKRCNDDSTADACLRLAMADSEERWLSTRKAHAVWQAQLLEEIRRGLPPFFAEVKAIEERARASKNEKLRRHGARVASGLRALEMTTLVDFAHSLRKQCDEMNTLHFSHHPE